MQLPLLFQLPQLSPQPQLSDMLGMPLPQLLLLLQLSLMPPQLPILSLHQDLLPTLTAPLLQL